MNLSTTPNNNTLCWAISTEGGTTFELILSDEKTTDDTEHTPSAEHTLFSNEKLTETEFILTLADKNRFILPPTSSITVKLGGEEMFFKAGETSIKILLPNILQGNNFVAIMAQITSNIGTDIKTETDATDLWTVVLTKPIFNSERIYQKNAEGIIRQPNFAIGGLTVLKVTVIDNSSNEISASPLIDYGVIVKTTAGKLATTINNGIPV